MDCRSEIVMEADSNWHTGGAEIPSATGGIPTPSSRDTLPRVCMNDVLGAGCLLAIVFAAIMALTAIILTAIFSAPALIVEVFLDAFILTVLLPHLRIAQQDTGSGRPCATDSHSCAEQVPLSYLAATCYSQGMQLAAGEGLLRPWRREDAPALAAAANNRNVWLTLRDRMPHPYSCADAEAYIEQRIKEESELVLCVEVEGQAAGGIGLHPGDDVNRVTAELGYWLAEPCWGRGIITAAVGAMVRYGFARLPLNRIEGLRFREQSSFRARSRESRLRLRGPDARQCDKRWPGP